jgi:hypothetical protein
LFKKPGGAAGAGGVWEKQSAAVLRVFGLQCSVFRESQKCVTERQNSTPVTAERRPDGTETRLIFR